MDSYWASSAIYRKSTSWCWFSMGSGVISWFNRKQSCVALITAKAKYVAACSATYEVVWLRKLLSNLFDLQLDATCIYCDNQSCVNLSENAMFHENSKHIEIKYHYIRHMAQRRAMKFQYVATNEQIVDVFIKPLVKVKFEYFNKKLGVLQIELPSKGK